MPVPTLRRRRLAPPVRTAARPAGSASAVLSALALCGATAALLLLFYVVSYPLHGFRVAIGSDTPWYVWLARHAGVEGMGEFRTGTRPGMIGPLAVLSTVTGAPVSAVAAAIGAVLATALALATAAFVDVCLGRDRPRFAVVTLLTGTFLSLMVPGWFATLAFGAMFLAALACLAYGVDRGGWSPIAAAGLLLAGAASAHPLFLLLAAAVLGGAALALLPASRRDGTVGLALHETPVGRLGIASLVGTGLAALTLGVTGVGPNGRLIETARDSLLRRNGLGGMIEQSFRGKLLHDFPWFRVATVAGLALTPLWTRRTAAAGGAKGRGAQDERREARRLLWGALGAWLAVTLAGVGLLLAGTGVPGQRLAAFCLPLPVLAAIGLRDLPAGRGFRRAPIAAALMGVGVVVFGFVAWLDWREQKPLVSARAISQSHSLGRAFEREPEGRPLVVVMDDRSDKPGLSIVRYENYLRQEAPAGRIEDLYVFVGRPADFLARRPPLIGQTEHDRLALTYWSRLRTVLPGRPLAVVVEAFDPRGYHQAAKLDGVKELSPEVLALPGFGPSSAVVRPVPSGGDRAPGPLSPWLPLWLAPLLLALLGGVGWPWARAAVRGATRLNHLTSVALSPAFGLAALAFSSTAVDAAGLRLSGAGAVVALGVAAGGGLVALGVAAEEGLVAPLFRRPSAAPPVSGDGRQR